jgi:hypothetical protein
LTSLIPSQIESENVIQNVEPQFSIEPEDHQDVDLKEQGSKDPDSPADNDWHTDVVDNPNEVIVDIENCQTPEDCQKQEEVAKALLRRTRYLLTLKGRSPFRLAGVEMYERLTELSENLDDFISHYAEPRLVAWKPGLKTALQAVEKDYHQLQIA